jgi:hypothetical protein
MGNYKGCVVNQSEARLSGLTDSSGNERAAGQSESTISDMSGVEEIFGTQHYPNNSYKRRGHSLSN